MSRSTVRYDRVGSGSPDKVPVVSSPTGGDLARRRMRGTQRLCQGQEREPRAIKCIHCGFPIKDYAAIETCPVCESDNVRGRRHRSDR